MTPTQQLKDEHEAILLAIKIMREICDRMEAGSEIETGHLDRMIEFIRVFADKFHHAKEEDLLFVAMEEAGIPKEGGPIAVMLQEHEIGRGYVKEMAESVDQIKKSDKSASQKFINAARNYADLLTQHIEKENDILYMMADTHIPEKKQKELLAEFDRVERERVGKGEHEQFRRLLSELEGVYLK